MKKLLKKSRSILGGSLLFTIFALCGVIADMLGRAIQLRQPLAVQSNAFKLVLLLNIIIVIGLLLVNYILYKINLKKKYSKRNINPRKNPEYLKYSDNDNGVA